MLKLLHEFYKIKVSFKGRKLYIFNSKRTTYQTVININIL